jgi:5-methylcytosine-specific restriction endonuclease McrBC GTP-binding regulatory subunit McrB
MLRQDSEAFGLGAKIKPETYLSAYEGKSVLLTIASEDRNVPMMVTAIGTDAKNDGNDVMFMLCSEKCGIKMKAALQREIKIGDLFDGINPL